MSEEHLFVFPKSNTNFEMIQLAGCSKGTSRVTTWRVSLEVSRTKRQSPLVMVSSLLMILALLARHVKNYSLPRLHVSCNIQASCPIEKSSKRCSSRMRFKDMFLSSKT